MSSLSIVAPIPIVGITASRGSNVARLLTGNPREVWLDNAVASVATIGIDLGSVQPVDTVFLGFTNAGDGATMVVTSGTASAGEATWPSAVLPAPYKTTRRPRHGFAWRSKLVNHPEAGTIRVGDPINARYIDVRVTQPAGNAALYAGCIAAGLAFQPALGREYGGGRTPIDTGSRERLPSGGFGVSPGIVKGSWDWTMGDLYADEVDRLYDIALQLGETRDVLVVEDPEVSPGLNERLHWGMFDKLQAYERINPALTRWSFRIEDWA